MSSSALHVAFWGILRIFSPASIWAPDTDRTTDHKVMFGIHILCWDRCLERRSVPKAIRRPKSQRRAKGALTVGSSLSLFSKHLCRLQWIPNDISRVRNTKDTLQVDWTQLFSLNLNLKVSTSSLTPQDPS